LNRRHADFQSDSNPGSDYDSTPLPSANPERHNSVPGRPMTTFETKHIDPADLVPWEGDVPEPLFKETP
jgi:hypothetical protein